MAYLSFHFLDLTSQVTGGLVQNLSSLGSLLGDSQWIMYVVGAIVGVGMICLFPIHWALMYNPGDVMLLLALILPWILTCAITSGLFAHSPKGGFNTSMAIGIGYMVAMMLPYAVVAIAAGGFLSLLNGVALGLTDLPWVLAVILACLEGAAVGGVFGALVGSLKYEGEGGGGKKKEKKSREKMKEPSFGGGSSSSSGTSLTSKSKSCNNCGAKLTSGDDFCTNCGAKN